MLLLKHIHTHTSQLSFLHCHVLVFILFRLLQLYPVFPSSILVMYLSTYHVHTEVPHWPDESLCEVESCCQPEAHGCLIPIVSGHLGPPPRSTIRCYTSSLSPPFGSANSVSARTTSTWAYRRRSAVRGKSQPSPSTRLLARRSSSVRCPIQHRSPRHLVGWTRMRM